MRTIAEDWQVFKRRVIDAGANEVTVEAMRLGFYAGATAIIATVVHSDVEGTTADIRRSRLNSLNREVQVFHASILNDHLPIIRAGIE